MFKQLFGLLPRPILWQLHPRAGHLLLLRTLLALLHRTTRPGRLPIPSSSTSTAPALLALWLGRLREREGLRVVLRLLGHLGSDKLLDLAEGTVLPNELEGGLGSDALGRLEVVASEKNAELDELAVESASGGGQSTTTRAQA
jgi:hypothetical protein